ncbi:MAG: hypothetical protein AAFO89_14385, partial [Planctomycetota bacterium]
MTQHFAAASTVLIWFTSAVNAQSDPTRFGEVYNIGTVPAGSIFDIPSAVTGMQVGDGDAFDAAEFITPTRLDGDTIPSDTQLNVFGDGEVLSF